ncbi:MAG: hypothetical protein GXP17_10215, partial [Gammaproteobacteria bacterium]|nr:hypothetical protein [Gammaproteobacteria bacterium]
YLMFKKSNLHWLLLLSGAMLPTSVYSTSSDAYLNFGIGLQNFGYKEFDTQNVLLDREDGLLPGLVMEFGKNWQSVSLALRFERFDGPVNYDGQTQAGTALVTKTDERITTVETQLRFKLKQFPQHDVMLIAGLGYREWRRNIRATNTTSRLFEVYRWNYLSLGGAATLWRRGQWSGGIDVRWLRPVRPNISVNVIGFDEINLDLKPRNSARVSFPFHMGTMAGQSWMLTPYWESWYFERSEEKRLTMEGMPSAFVVSEPRSETNILGITLSVQLAL